MKLGNCDEIFYENIIYGIFKINSQNQKLFFVTFWNWVLFYGVDRSLRIRINISIF